MPRFPDRWPPGPAPPVRYEGLFDTAGRPEPVPPAPPPAAFVAMAVGKTKEGESLPAKPVGGWSAQGSAMGQGERLHTKLRVSRTAVGGSIVSCGDLRIAEGISAVSGS